MICVVTLVRLSNMLHQWPIDVRVSLSAMTTAMVRLAYWGFVVVDHGQKLFPIAVVMPRMTSKYEATKLWHLNNQNCKVRIY